MPSYSPVRGKSKMPKISEIGSAVQKLWPIPREVLKHPADVSLYNYIGQNRPKNSLKCPFFGQKSTKWPKNRSYDVFIWFLSIPKFLENFAIFWPIFGQKTAFFYRLGKKMKIIFRRKIELVLGKWSNWSENLWKCTQGYPLQFSASRILIVAFFLILRLPKCNFLHFFAGGKFAFRWC